MATEYKKVNIYSNVKVPLRALDIGIFIGILLLCVLIIWAAVKAKHQSVSAVSQNDGVAVQSEARVILPDCNQIKIQKIFSDKQTKN